MRFVDGVDRLKEAVGHGKLEGVVTVDQKYAWNQHESYWRTGPNAGVIIRNHPRGGQAKFLSEPLLDGAHQAYADMAALGLHEHGLRDGMRQAADRLADRVHELAPRENDVLRNSAKVQIIDDGRVVFERPPGFPRLSAEELKLIKAGHATPHEVIRRRG